MRSTVQDVKEVITSADNFHLICACRKQLLQAPLLARPTESILILSYTTSRVFGLARVERPAQRLSLKSKDLVFLVLCQVSLLVIDSLMPSCQAVHPGTHTE